MVTLARMIGFLLLIGILPTWAAEGIEGTWRMTRQEVGGQPAPAEALLLDITAVSEGLRFTYSRIVNGTSSVIMRFSVRLDGTEAEIRDAGTNRLGTASLTKNGGSQYRLILRSPVHPPTAGTMTVSDGGKTLTSESDTEKPGGGIIHAVQVFSSSK